MWFRLANVTLRSAIGFTVSNQFAFIGVHPWIEMNQVFRTCLPHIDQPRHPPQHRRHRGGTTAPVVPDGTGSARPGGLRGPQCLSAVPTRDGCVSPLPRAPGARSRRWGCRLRCRGAIRLKKVPRELIIIGRPSVRLGTIWNSEGPNCRRSEEVPLALRWSVVIARGGAIQRTRPS